MNPSSSNQDGMQTRDSYNSLYMTSETTGSTDSLQPPPSSITRASRHFGNITIAMIDDFFTTADNSMKLPNNPSGKLKFLPPPTSALMQYANKETPAENQEDFNEYLPGYRRKEDNKADYDYAKIKAEYETQLKREKLEKELQERRDAYENTSSVGGHERSESIVGSNVNSHVS